MASLTARDTKPAGIQQGFPPPSKKEGVVYAISFDMDVNLLRTHYGDPYNGAYAEIRQVLQTHGFTRQQGSVYFGGAATTAIDCVHATQDLATLLPWFAACVRDIRMLRIEDNNDLMPAVRRAAGARGVNGVHP